MDESTSPGVAGVGFAVSKRRREAGDMRAHDRILGELSGTEKQARIALALEGRAAARTGADIVKDGQTVGHVTSGAYSPSLGHAIALGFAPKVLTEPGTEVSVHLRGKPVPATAVSLPFRPSNYVRRSDLAA
jgi:aminomethyltransferase